MISWTWDDVYTAIRAMPPGKVWGVPRGGQIVAGLTGRAVDTPDEADVLVDDVIDSGATMARYQALYPEKQFWALARRQGEWLQFPWEVADTTTDIADTVLRQLEFLGEDVTREGLKGTPGRVIRMLQEMTSGAQQDPAAILGTVFTEPCDEMIVVRAIPFSSLCEHHLLPFHGLVSVGYVPAQNRVVGLSKIPRLVRCFARRLQIQERLTTQIATALQEVLAPKGVGVVITAQHSCMHMRGVQSPGAMHTSCLLGIMRETPAARAEFLALASIGL